MRLKNTLDEMVLLEPDEFEKVSYPSTEISLFTVNHVFEITLSYQVQL